MTLAQRVEEQKELAELEERINEANRTEEEARQAAKGPEGAADPGAGGAAPGAVEDEGAAPETALPGGDAAPPARAPLLAGRFQSPNELEKAYRSLEAAYTRKAQLLSLLGREEAPERKAPAPDAGTGKETEPDRLADAIERRVSESLRPYAEALAAQGVETAFRTLDGTRQTRLLNTLKQFPVLRAALKGLVSRVSLADVPSIEDAAWQLIELADGYTAPEEAAALREAGKEEASHTLRKAQKAFAERSGPKGAKRKAIDVNDPSTFEHLSLQELEDLIQSQAPKKA